jgi:CubicO group peptidase (beta-lactamase class C family)
MRNEIATRIEQAIAERVTPGCIVGIIHTNGERELFPIGRFTYNTDSPQVTEDTIYDLASVTKSIPVASLTALFIAEGKLALNDTVKKYIPELENDFGATIEDLLRYRVRGAQMSALNYPTFEQVRTHIFEKGFDGPPGESEYTNLPAFLLGIILERVGAEILPALSHKYFFGPLEMRETTFFPHDVSRVAPTEFVEDLEIQAIVHDESARKFAEKRRAVGHAGLFSTAPDLLNFLEALLQGKFPLIIEMAQDGLGWQREGAILGSHPMAGMFGKTGFTGTSVVVDPKKEIAYVLLSNRTHPTRPANSDGINSLRRDIADIILG